MDVLICVSMNSRPRNPLPQNLHLLPISYHSPLPRHPRHKHLLNLNHQDRRLHHLQGQPYRPLRRVTGNKYTLHEPRPRPERRRDHPGPANFPIDRRYCPSLCATNGEDSLTISGLAGVSGESNTDALYQ